VNEVNFLSDYQVKLKPIKEARTVVKLRRWNTKLAAA
jgi:hypothetical protein